MEKILKNFFTQFPREYEIILFRTKKFNQYEDICM